MKKIKTILISFILATIGGIFLFILGFVISIWIVPNITSDGHVEMALPQMIIAIFIGSIGFTIISIVVYKQLKRI